jgi:hypothetical protein
MSERKQRFFVMDNPQLGMRYVFEVYETIDRVVVLATRNGSNTDAHNYQTYTMDDARRIWRTLFINPPHIYTRNTEMEKELNASR